MSSRSWLRLCCRAFFTTERSLCSESASTCFSSGPAPSTPHRPKASAAPLTPVMPGARDAFARARGADGLGKVRGAVDPVLGQDRIHPRRQRLGGPDADRRAEHDGGRGRGPEQIERRDRNARAQRLGCRGQVARHHHIGRDDMPAGQRRIEQHRRHGRDAAEGAREAEIEGHEIGHRRQVIRRPGKATALPGRPGCGHRPPHRADQLALGKKSCSPPTLNEAIAARPASETIQSMNAWPSAALTDGCLAGFTRMIP